MTRTNKARHLREAVVVLAVLALVVGSLFAYTRVWPPAVIVESGSMMHADSTTTFGRYGTIDPGDLVLVKRVFSPADVATLVEGRGGTYGKQGDVLIYWPANDRSSTPIIHRAIAWIEPLNSSYRVRWNANAPCVGGASKELNDARWCVYDSSGVTIPEANLRDYQTQDAGFVTKGDNPVSNVLPDPVVGISHDSRGRPSIVHFEWVEGKARGELPWLGLIKLALATSYNEPECTGKTGPMLWFQTIRQGTCAQWFGIGHAIAPKDTWIMLAVSLLLIIGGPLTWDAFVKRRHTRSVQRDDESDP